MRENEPETHENSWIHEQKLVRCIEGFHFQSQRDWMTGKRRWCPSPRNHACTWARAEKLKEQIQQELEKLWVQVLLHITWVSQWILDGVCELSLCLYPATCPKLQSIKKKRLYFTSAFQILHTVSLVGSANLKLCREEMLESNHSSFLVKVT